MYTFRRNVSEERMHVFKVSLNNVDWSDVMSNDDTQEAYSIFHERFKELYDKMFPLEKCKVKYKRCNPWITAGIKQSI